MKNKKMPVVVMETQLRRRGKVENIEESWEYEYNYCPEKDYSFCLFNTIQIYLI